MTAEIIDFPPDTARLSAALEAEQAQHTRPATPPRPTVMIATPFRDLPQDATVPEQVKYLDSRAPQIAGALRQLISMPEGAGYDWEFAAAVGGLCRARNNLVHEFLKAGYNWLLWWDADLVPDKPAEAVLRLLSHKQPIVGGIYCKREIGKKPVWAVSWIPKAEPQEKLLGCIQVAELAGGFTLFHRKAFLQIGALFEGTIDKPGIKYRERETGESMYGFYQIRVDNNELHSEDYWLCYLARCSNIGILADTQIKLRHRDMHGSEVRWYPENGKFPPVPGFDDKD